MERPTDIFKHNAEAWARYVEHLIYRTPYSDLDLTDAELARYLDKGEAVEFGHTLEDQLGGQIDAGFHLVGLFEDHAGDEDDVLRKHLDAFIATRARKPVARC